jgi:hypothetical protein
MFYKRLLVSFLTSLGLFLALVSAAGAVPPLPFIVYGRALVNGADATPGSQVTAWINGSSVAQTTVISASGQSLYVLDIPGDASWNPNAGQPSQEGTVITFTVAGYPAGQSATWSSGGMQTVDLNATAAGSSVASVMLAPGWNLLALAITPANPAPAAVFAGIQGQYDLVYAYNVCDSTDPWKKYDPNAPPFVNDLNNLTVALGLWVRAASSTTLTISGTAPGTASIPLCVGWNLIGYPSASPRSLPDALASIAGKYDLVYTYNASDVADPWKKFDPNAPPFVNDLTQMRAGVGYWVRVTQAATLIVN